MDKAKKSNQNDKHQKKALGLINKPEKPLRKKQTYKRIACVFQGGGALGAYQVGAFRAIHEQGYQPNFLAGVSIGSINCAIIAGNPPEKQVEQLFNFWNTIAPHIWCDPLDHNHIDPLHHMHNSIGALHSVLFGLDGFFKPRVIPPTFLSCGTPDNLSYYDTSELHQTLEKLIDFDLINSKKITLCLGSVNVHSGEMHFFNNQKMRITPKHVMASGALPPGLPAIKIGKHYFWDGGIYANTPLVTVLDALPEEDTLCFVVDCFSLKGHLPQTMDQLQERQKDIRYASHSRRLTNVYTSRQNLQAAIDYLGKHLPPETRKKPEIKKLLALGQEKRFSVVHIIYQGSNYSHSFKDFNFARSAIEHRLESGYEDAMEVLSEPVWEKKSKKNLACSIYGVPNKYYDQR